MRKQYQTRKVVKKDDLYVDREVLLRTIDDVAWDHVVPFRALSGQIVHLDELGERMESKWYEGVRKKVVSSDIELTKRYLPELYKTRLCGYVHHLRKKQPDAC